MTSNSCEISKLDPILGPSICPQAWSENLLQDWQPNLNWLFNQAISTTRTKRTPKTASGKIKSSTQHDLSRNTHGCIGLVTNMDTVRLRGGLSRYVKGSSYENHTGLEAKQLPSAPASRDDLCASRIWMFFLCRTSTIRRLEHLHYLHYLHWCYSSSLDLASRLRSPGADTSPLKRSGWYLV